MCCPALLLCGDESRLLLEIESFTESLMDLRRDTALEKGRMDRSFPVFISNFLRLADSTNIHASSPDLDLLRACDTVPAQRLLRYLLCLSGSPLFPLSTNCISLDELTSDTTTSVFASILSFLKTHSISNFESVSGPFA